MLYIVFFNIGFLFSSDLFLFFLSDIEVVCRLKKWSFSSQRTKDAASDNFRDNLKTKIIDSIVDSSSNDVKSSKSWKILFLSAIIQFIPIFLTYF